MFFGTCFTLKKPALVFKIHFILHTKDLSVSTALLLLWSSPEKKRTITHYKGKEENSCIKHKLKINVQGLVVGVNNSQIDSSEKGRSFPGLSK